MAALQQAERGKLDLNAPVADYCPEFAELQVLAGFEGETPVLRPPASQATVRNLITHTSGLGYWFWNGELDGVRILEQSTVDEAFSNQIGDLDFPAELRTADPAASCDLMLGPGNKWGYGMLLNTRDVPGMRRAWSGAWAGLCNPHFWVDRASGVCASIYSNFLPFVTPEALKLYQDFERALYASL